MEIIVALVVVGLIYFLPLIIALSRGHRNVGPILVVNIFFGWTLLGWVIALAWAVAYQSKTCH